MAILPKPAKLPTPAGKSGVGSKPRVTKRAAPKGKVNRPKAGQPAKPSKSSTPKASSKRTTPLSAQEKEARAAITAADAATLEANAAKTAQQTRGAFGARRLRAGGSDLQRYLLPGGYSDDPGLYPTVPKGGGSAPSGGTRQTTSKPKGGKRPVTDISHRKAVRKQTKMSDARGDSLDALRKRKQAEADARRREEARRKAEAERARLAANYRKAQAKRRPAAGSTPSRGMKQT